MEGCIDCFVSSLVFRRFQISQRHLTKEMWSICLHRPDRDPAVTTILGEQQTHDVFHCFMLNTKINSTKCGGGVKWPVSNSRRSSLDSRNQMVLRPAQWHESDQSYGWVRSDVHSAMGVSQLIEFTCCHSPWNRPTGYMYTCLSHPTCFHALWCKLNSCNKAWAKYPNTKFWWLKYPKWLKCAPLVATLMCWFLSNRLMAWSWYDTGWH